MSDRAVTFAPGSGVAHSVAAHARSIAPGFAVQRMLPAIEQRAVGPFIFLDQMGPVVFHAGADMDVPPHPHIGLATVTYLIEGEIVHRDSLGSMQTIRPGEINWMTAGRGIVHSERSPEHLRQTARPTFGLQFWVGLPQALEETDPAFAHHGADELPTVIAEGGARLRVAVGEFLGRRSPVATLWTTLLVDIELAPGATFDVPPTHSERAIQVAHGTVEIGGARADAPRVLVLETGAVVSIRAAEAGARCILFGGDPLDGAPRHMYWNFVSSSKGRIESAKTRWREQRFPRIPGETDFVPLPP